MDVLEVVLLWLVADSSSISFISFANKLRSVFVSILLSSFSFVSSLFLDGIELPEVAIRNVIKKTIVMENMFEMITY